MNLIKNSEVFRKFSGIAGTINNSGIENWKKKGGRVIGYTCSFVPEELFIAAGLLPFRIRGTGSQSADLANDYFEAANICSLVRHCFNHVLLGEYNFLDGAVIGGGCDAARHIVDNWQKSDAKTPFLHRLLFPHASGELMSEYFRNQLAELKAGLEKHFEVEITDEKLWNAIKLCNSARDLQKELYALRKAENPPVTGAETVAVIVAGNSMPKEEYIADLKILLDELRNTPKSSAVTEKKYKARLMIVGPGHDDTSMCDIIEELGGLVVTDLTCFGAKLIFGSVKENGTDPLKAIADYQILDRPFCPKNLGAHTHISKEIFENIKDYKVDGVIGQIFLCCDTWGGEIYILEKELKDIGIPVLRIEREYIPDSLGQLQTRVQAFLETLSGGLL
jgi:benzoyl-CoA reductase/2-hydroxyglutaryl-CoA dehydratase subunit BcrC/BadD/HgdB